MTGSLRWRRAVVTGSSGGIGRGFTDELVAQGIAVTGFDRVEAPPTEHERTETVDLASAEGRAAAAATTTAVAPDLAVLNAGVGTTRPYIDGDDELDAALVGVNITSTLVVLGAALPGLLDASGDAILLSSMSAYQPNAATPLYTATKSFLAVFGPSLRRQLLGRAGVTTAHPGMTHTAIFHAAGAEPRSVVPERFWSTPPVVARGALRAAHDRRAVVTPGRAYAVLAPVAELMPRRLGTRLAASADRATTQGARPPSFAAGSGKAVLVGDDPAAATALVLAICARGGRVVVVGATRPASVPIDDFVPADLASPEGQAAAAEAVAGADLVMMTATPRQTGAFAAEDGDALEARIAACVPGICRLTRASMRRAVAAGDPTVVLVARETGLRGDAGDPIGAGLQAFVLSLGSSLSLQAAGTGARVAAAVGALDRPDLAAGERALRRIDRGDALATGFRVVPPGSTTVGVARGRRSRWRPPGPGGPYGPEKGIKSPSS